MMPSYVPTSMLRLKPDWRARAAKQYVEQDRQPPEFPNDWLLKFAYEFLVTSEGARPDPSLDGVAAAFDIAAGPLRPIVEALILAKANDQQIADCCSLPLDAVTAFASVFFDVRDRLEAKVFVGGFLLRCDDARVAAIRRVGYCLGVDAVLQFVGAKPMTAEVREQFWQFTLADAAVNTLIASIAWDITPATAMEAMKTGAQLKKVDMMKERTAHWLKGRERHLKFAKDLLRMKRANIRERLRVMREENRELWRHNRAREKQINDMAAQLLAARQQLDQLRPQETPAEESPLSQLRWDPPAPQEQRNAG